MSSPAFAPLTVDEYVKYQSNAFKTAHDYIMTPHSNDRDKIIVNPFLDGFPPQTLVFLSLPPHLVKDKTEIIHKFNTLKSKRYREHDDANINCFVCMHLIGRKAGEEYKAAIIEASDLCSRDDYYSLAIYYNHVTPVIHKFPSQLIIYRETIVERLNKKFNELETEVGTQMTYYDEFDSEYCWSIIDKFPGPYNTAVYDENTNNIDIVMTNPPNQLKILASLSPPKHFKPDLNHFLYQLNLHFTNQTEVHQINEFVNKSLSPWMNEINENWMVSFNASASFPVFSIYKTNSISNESWAHSYNSPFESDNLKKTVLERFNSELKRIATKNKKKITQKELSSFIEFASERVKRDPLNTGITIKKLDANNPLVIKNASYIVLSFTDSYDLGVARVPPTLDKYHNEILEGIKKKVVDSKKPLPKLEEHMKGFICSFLKKFEERLTEDFLILLAHKNNDEFQFMVKLSANDSVNIDSPFKLYEENVRVRDELDRLANDIIKLRKERDPMQQIQQGIEGMEMKDENQRAEGQVVDDHDIDVDMDEMEPGAAPKPPGGC